MDKTRFVSILSLLAFACFAGDPAKTVVWADLPAAAQQAITGLTAGGKIVALERDTWGGETVFEVNYTSKSGEHDFTVADDGTLLSVGVSLSETPASVQKTIRAQTPGWEIAGINKNLTEASVTFDVTMAKDGRERSFTVEDDGTLSSKEVELAETPAPVQAAIKAELGDGLLRYIDEDFAPEGNTFDVEAVTRSGARKTFNVEMNGRIASEGVTLEQVPPAARKTIVEKIGGGKILEIDRCFLETRAAVSSYAVQGRQQGHEFDFSVGPRGRFLGRD